MIHLITLLIASLTVIAGMKRLSYGCAIMIAAHTLIPHVARVGSLSLNSFNITVLLIISIYKVLSNKSSQRILQKKRNLYPALLMLILLFLGVFGTVVPFSFQAKAWAQFFLTEIAPFYVTLLSIRNKEDFNLILNTIGISYLVIGIYSLFAYAIRSNMLFLAYAQYYGMDERMLNALTEIHTGMVEYSRGGMSFFTSGSYMNGLDWGQVSLLFMLLSVSVKVFDKKNLQYAFVFVAFFNCFFCTKRSVILPSIITLFFFLWSQKLFSPKRILITFLIAIPSLFILYQNPKTHSLVKNIETAIFFWDDRLAARNDVEGSSKAMRLEQTAYAVHMVADAPLQGLGFAYPSYYSSTKGLHKHMLGFESILYMIVPSGIIGLFGWLMLFYIMYRNTLSRRMRKSRLIIFHGMYFLSIILTGLQASLSIYMIFVALLYHYKVFYSSSNLLNYDIKHRITTSAR